MLYYFLKDNFIVKLKVKKRKKITYYKCKANKNKSR